METWTKVLFNAAVATTITNISLSRTAPAALDKLVVDATLAVAQLGPSLLPILSWLSTSTSTNQRHANMLATPVACFRDLLELVGWKRTSLAGC
jgi:hypothetical protein